MQRRQLNVSGILHFASEAHGEREIVSRQIDDAMFRGNYRRCHARAVQAGCWLSSVGVRPGDRVTTLAWNTHRHFELLFAVPGIGAVLHTANPRLPDEQIAYTINHAGSRVLLYDSNLAPLVDRLRPLLFGIAAYIVLSSDDYDRRIADFSEAAKWPELDENAAAILCYTSGTTGSPKGVLYSHRSILIHAMMGGLSGAFGLSALDAILPCSSLYHATAWGLPFSGTIAGAKWVFPADKMDGASLDDLIRGEGVTMSGGVPTIWTMYLDHLARTGHGTGNLDRIVIGGSAVPRAMAEKFKQQYGVKVNQIWGMTETSPIGVVSTLTPQIAALGDAEADEIMWTRQGRMQFGIELKIVDEGGAVLPHDGVSSGTLLVRGPWTIARYYGSCVSACDADGWFDTGDVATIDANGFLRLTDRKKDVIKSGGEWISSIDIENIAVACPGVKIAAVVGVFHTKWEERPVLVIERHHGATVEEAEIFAWLEIRLVKWWMPDKIVFDNVPLTATGKIDKKALRGRYADILRSA
jgi:acyl-CoA synthetase (AMP-forming)/AMP-acid ligase II